MTVAIMQPYLFPFIGYFQLINAADKFVLFDEAQYIKGGWINRNRILLNRRDFLVTFSLQQASATDLINQRSFVKNLFPKEKKHFFNLLSQAYSKAAYYKPTMLVLEQVFLSDDLNISHFIRRSLRMICQHLNIQTEIVSSEELSYDRRLRAQDRVIAMNLALNSDHYINPIRGSFMYSKEDFAKSSIKLSFLKSNEVPYPQLDNEKFIPWLSIIDVMMFNSPREISSLLKRYILE